MCYLHQLCNKGDIEQIKKYISNPNFNVDELTEEDYYGHTSFSNACHDDNIDIVKLLISIKEFNCLNRKSGQREKLFSDQETPFIRACYKGHIDIIKL